MSTTNSLSLQLRSLASTTHDAAMIQPFRDMAKLAEELEARPLAPPPAKELSDEEIERIITYGGPAIRSPRLAELQGLNGMQSQEGRDVIRYLSENGYLATKEDQTT